MEVLGLVDIPTWLQWLILLVGTVIAYVVYMSWHHTTFKKMGIDGPKPHPILGNLRAHFKEGMVKADQSFYEKYGKMFGIFKEFNNFVNRRSTFNDAIDEEMSKMLSRLHDDQWRNVRNIITPTFSGKKLRLMTPLINGVADKLMKNIEIKIDADEDIDLHKMTSAFTLDVIASTCFGLNVDTQTNPDDPFLKHAFVFRSSKWLIVIAMCTMFFPFMSRLPRLLGLSPTKKASQFFVKATKEALAERRANPGVYADFMNIMAEAGNAEEMEKSKSKTALTESEIASQAVMFFLGGFETTSGTMTFLMYHLVIYPEVCDKVLEEIDDKLGESAPDYDNVHELTYLEMCINETMRLYPLASRIDRVASRDIVIDNVKIPKGMILIMLIGAIQRDPQYWPEPEKFIPERFTAEAKSKMDPFVFLPFGAGPRNCVGLRLALLKMKIATARMLQKFRPIRSPNTKVPIEIMKMGNRPSGFVMKFEKRK